MGFVINRIKLGSLPSSGILHRVTVWLVSDVSTYRNSPIFNCQISEEEKLALQKTSINRAMFQTLEAFCVVVALDSCTGAMTTAPKHRYNYWIWRFRKKNTECYFNDKRLLLHTTDPMKQRRGACFVRVDDVFSLQGTIAALWHLKSERWLWRQQDALKLCHTCTRLQDTTVQNKTLVAPVIWHLWGERQRWEKVLLRSHTNMYVCFCVCPSIRPSLTQTYGCDFSSIFGNRQFGMCEYL
jgi:hypothetical protein